jgi:acyl-coenzyme A thioesterase PaaI-like protein
MARPGDDLGGRGPTQAREPTQARGPGIAGDVRVRGRRLELVPHNCFACGTLNAQGLQLRLHATGDRCWTELVLSDRFEGWEGIAHGGVLSTILDEVMAWALVDRDNWGVTARLSVEFRRPVPIGRPIRAEGWVVDERRRLVTTSGRLLDAASGEELATATAVYVGAGEARKAELKARYGARFVAESDAEIDAVLPGTVPADAPWSSRSPVEAPDVPGREAG